MNIQNKPVACNLEAIPSDQRDRHFATLQALQEHIQERRELADGYAFQLPPEPAIAKKIIEFITLERKCCPFFTFELKYEPDGGALWWKITGPDGSKEILSGL